MTGTVPSLGRGGTAAAMVQNEQTAEEHSTLEQQPPENSKEPRIFFGRDLVVLLRYFLNTTS